MWAEKNNIWEIDVNPICVQCVKSDTPYNKLYRHTLHTELLTTDSLGVVLPGNHRGEQCTAAQDSKQKIVQLMVLLHTLH